MTRESDRVEQLARSWEDNAEAWTHVVRNGAIESRPIESGIGAVARVSARWTDDAAMPLEHERPAAIALILVLTGPVRLG
jgi:hypothetical protein